MITMMTISLVIFTTIIFLIGVITGGLCIFKLGKELNEMTERQASVIQDISAEQKAFDNAWNIKKEI